MTGRTLDEARRPCFRRVGSRSSFTPSGVQLRTTELQERVPREPAPEQKNSGGILTGEEDQRLPQFTLRGRDVARALGHDSQVKVGHGKTGVEINGGLAVLDGSGRIAGIFAAEGHEQTSSSASEKRSCLTASSTSPRSHVCGGAVAAA